MYDLTQMADGSYRAESKLTGITLIWRKGDFEASQEVIYEQPLFDKWCSKRKNLTLSINARFNGVYTLLYTVRLIRKQLYYGKIQRLEYFRNIA